MYIREIELNNFRIYKGKNKIDLSPETDKNIAIISGKNGFGKTTFLCPWFGAFMGSKCKMLMNSI